MAGQKLERLLNLTALLLDARRPLTAEHIQRQAALGYSEDRVAFRRAFERDKEELRAMGIPDPIAHGSIRLSISRETTAADITKAIPIIAEAVRTVSKSAASVG